MEVFNIKQLQYLIIDYWQIKRKFPDNNKLSPLGKTNYEITMSKEVNPITRENGIVV